jgi:hypothetical protein
MSKGKLNDKVHDSIVSSIKSGSFQTVAAQRAGIAISTFRSWMDRGEMEQARIDEGFDPDVEEAKYLRFKQDVDVARAIAEIEAVKMVRGVAASGTWQAAAWYLERSFPQRWARNREEEAPATKETADPEAALGKLLARLDSLDARNDG